MKRLVVLSVAALIVLLGACAPQVHVQNNVLPTLFSVTVPQDGGNRVLLQGRYFSDGMGGKSPDSYVIFGADINGNGGIRVRASSWSPGRIVALAPKGAGSGYVFVVVRGVMSNGLPSSLN